MVSARIGAARSQKQKDGNPSANRAGTPGHGIRSAIPRHADSLPRSRGGILKKMPSAPWFKFFAADYLSSPFVQALDPEQELWYVRLLIASAIAEPRGCLPLANGKLWRLAKAPSLEHFEKHAGPILAKFEKDEAAGLYRIAKIANQMTSVPNLSEKRSEAGKKGAAKRWQTNGKLPSATMANAKANGRQKIADSDSDTDTDKKNIPLNPPSGDLTPRQLANLSKELDRIYGASQGANVNEEDALRTACARLLLPLDSARKAMQHSYGDSATA